MAASGEVGRSEDLDAVAERAMRADSARVEAPAAPGPAPAPADPQAMARDAIRDKWIEAATFYGDGLRAMLAANPANADKLAAWTPEAFQKLGYAVARCAERYGWKMGEEIDHPLPALVMAAAPMFWPFLAPYIMPRIQAMTGGAPEAGAAPDAPEATPAARAPATVKPLS